MRGLTSLSLSSPDINYSFSPADSSHIRCANGFSNGVDRVSNWCHLACKTWWMLVPIQAEQRTDWGVRGDIWLLASCRLINWSHTETKGMLEMLLTEIWDPDIIWCHLGRIYSSISQQHVFKLLFKSDCSVFYHLPCPLPLCVAGILSLEDTLVIILCVSQAPSICLFLSAFVSPWLRSSEHLHTIENKAAHWILRECMRVFPRDTQFTSILLTHWYCYIIKFMLAKNKH